MPFNVYKITNTVNGMLYIGVTQMEVEFRWAEHKKGARLGVKKYLYTDMRSYGIDAFCIEQVDTCSGRAAMFRREIELIKELKTGYPNGYNVRER